MEEKRCQEKGCSGILNANSFVPTQVGGCSISSLAYPCSVCGRLYRWNGPEPIFGENGRKLYLEEGKFVLKDADIQPDKAFA